MNINKNQLNEAFTKGIITQPQIEQLWQFLEECNKDTPTFKFVHVLYYLGGLIAIGAMSLFMTLGWEMFGGWAIFFISIIYATAGVFLTNYFLNKLKLAIPAGIAATFVVVLTPLAIYGLQNGLGIWSDGNQYREYHTHINMCWFLMELGTLAAGAIMLWVYRLPFIVMPIAITLWYMSMDLTPLLFGEENYWQMNQFVSLWFGLIIVLLAIWIDIRSAKKRDYSFWLYIFGVIAFWGAMTSMHSDDEFKKFIYLCINLVMVLVGSILSRRVFTIFGAIGITCYLGYLSYNVFRDSLLFPLFLTILGLGIVYLGIIWQKFESKINQKIFGMLHPNLQKMLERD
jgi:hypothetical protein